MPDILAICIMIGSVTLSCLAQVLLKKSAGKPHSSALTEYVNPYVICGYGMIFCSMLISILIFRFVDYKNGPLIETLGIVIVTILSRLFFREKITLRKLIGGTCIIAGILIFYLWK